MLSKFGYSSGSVHEEASKVNVHGNRHRKPHKTQKGKEVMRKIRLWIVLSTLGIVLLGAGACSPAEQPKPTKPVATATLPLVDWQRPTRPIDRMSVEALHLTGILQQHQSTVNAVDFSRSGTRMATVGADDQLVVWNLASGEPLIVQDGNQGRAMFFGPEDAQLVTITPTGRVDVWTINVSPPRSLELLTRFQGHVGRVTAVAHSPDRTLLAFGGVDGSVHLWRLPQGEPVAEFTAHAGTVQALAFAPNGQSLVTVSMDRGVSLWQLPDGTLLHKFTDPEKGAVDIVPLDAAFSPDGTLLAVSTEDGVRTWDVASGKERYTIQAVQNAAANTLTFSPDGTLLVGCGSQPLIGVWEAQSGAALGLLPTQGELCANVVFSPDSALLAVMPRPGRDVYLWNLEHIHDEVPPEEKQLARVDRHALGLPPGVRFYDVAWSPDGRFLVVLDEVGPIYVLSVAE